MPTDLLISIVTPCFNRADFITRAIESVLEQDYPKIEHIIIDGGSTDGTLEILAQYPHLKVVSEPDQGVYDALNKGIKLAHGKIIGQLNSDDYYKPNILSDVMNVFKEHPQTGVVSTGARVFERMTGGQERDIISYPPIERAELPYRATIGVPIFNAWFFRKRVFDRIGTYSLKYPIYSDRDFLIRLALSNEKIITLNQVSYHYCQHPGSLSINQHRTQEPYWSEKLCIAEKHIEQITDDLLIYNQSKDWHASISIELFILFSRQGEFINVAKAAFRALKYNPMWLFALLANGLPRLFSYFKRRF